MQRISWLIVTYSPLVSACSFFLLVAVKKNWKAIVARETKAQVRRIRCRTSRSLDPWLRAYLAVRRVGTSAYQLRTEDAKRVVAGVSVWQARRHVDGIPKRLSFLRERAGKTSRVPVVVHRFLFTVWIVFFERPLCRPGIVKFNRRVCIRFLTLPCRMLLIRRVVWKRQPQVRLSLSRLSSSRVCGILLTRGYRSRRLQELRCGFPKRVSASTFISSFVKG